MGGVVAVVDVFKVAEEERRGVTSSFLSPQRARLRGAQPPTSWGGAAAHEALTTTAAAREWK